MLLTVYIQQAKVGFGATNCYPGVISHHSYCTAVPCNNVSLHHSCCTTVHQYCLEVEFWWSLLVLSWAYASQLGVRGQRWGRPFQYFNHRHHRHWCPFEIVNASRSSRFIETIAMKSDNDELDDSSRSYIKESPDRMIRVGWWQREPNRGNFLSSHTLLGDSSKAWVTA